MSIENNISFDDNNFKYKSRSVLSTSEVPGMTRFLLKKGLVKNEKHANYLMIIVTILFLLASVYIFAFYVFDINLFKQKIIINEDQIDINKERIEKIKGSVNN